MRGHTHAPSCPDDLDDQAKSAAGGGVDVGDAEAKQGQEQGQGLGR